MIRESSVSSEINIQEEGVLYTFPLLFREIYSGYYRNTRAVKSKKSHIVVEVRELVGIGARYLYRNGIYWIRETPVSSIDVRYSTTIFFHSRLIQVLLWKTIKGVVEMKTRTVMYFVMSNKLLNKRIAYLNVKLSNETDPMKRIELLQDATDLLKAVIYKNRNNAQLMMHIGEQLKELSANSEVK